MHVARDRLRQKFLVANVVVFMKWGNKAQAGQIAWLRSRRSQF